MAVVEWERRGATALVTLNRPEARNAISPEVSATMVGVLDEIEADSALRAVVITGNGEVCLLYTSPSPRDGLLSRMPSSA